MANRIVPIMTSEGDISSKVPPNTITSSTPMMVATTTTGIPDHPICRTSVKLSITLDTTANSTPTAAYATRKLMRRDSLDRREAFLKGKEGSRQRRRWENDRLLSNPWAEPPLPSDWDIRPTYPTRTVPYYLAPLWDAAEFQRAVESKLRGRKNSSSLRNRAGQTTGISPMEEAAINIPKEVRAKLKHARSARGLLQDLEEDVRGFVRKWNEREAHLRHDGLYDVPTVSDSEEDEEIVFVGRNGTMHDSPGDKEGPREDGFNGTISREKLVFDGVEGDKGAAFARWLVHCVGSYYGLRTWSITREVAGQEKRREAYVGVDRRARGFMGRGVEVGKDIELPRPLWGMV